MMITTMVDLVVDLAALEHNYRQLRRLCAPQVKLLAVVKADAYGHGLLPVARKLAAAGADYLGVGSLEEGLMLRHAGISLPVLLLLGILPGEAERAVAADLEVSLFRLPGQKGPGAPEGGYRHGSPWSAAPGGHALPGGFKEYAASVGHGAGLPPGGGGPGG
jgi:alanine racemase